MTPSLTFRDVLFATDFSEASRLAGRTAADVARHFRARLHVLHVVPPVTDPTPAPVALRAAVAELEDGLSIVTAVTSGRVASQIVNYALCGATTQDELICETCRARIRREALDRKRGGSRGGRPLARTAAIRF